MKHLLAAILGLGLAFGSSAAVQVTKQYCDANAERAVTNSLQAAREYIPTVAVPIIGNVVTNYLLQEGRVITNVTREVHYIIETNTVEHTTIYTTNEFIIAVQEETNTTFLVDTAGELSIQKGSTEIWREKETMTPQQAGTLISNKVAEAVAPQNAIIATWESFLDGSNVVFSITNYISGSYNLDVAKLKILEMRDGVYREVYNSRDEVLLHVTNQTYVVETNLTKKITDSTSPLYSAISNKADKAWGKYSSTGTEIAVIGYSNTVYMTEPNTVFAGGTEYARFAVGEGSICILTTKGAPTYTTGDEGTFKFQDDGGTNYFGFAKTDSYVIGADAKAITVVNQMVTITYDVSSSVYPCIYYLASLDNYGTVAWEQLNTSDGQPIAGATHGVSWEPNPPEWKRICYINVTGEPKGFFKATIEVPGQVKFITNMPADLGAGIFCTDGQHKVKINWNNGNPQFVPAND